MFNSQLGQVLFEILLGEVSSSIASQDSRCTETRKNHALNHGNGLLRGSLTTWHSLYPIGYIINHDEDIVNTKKWYKKGTDLWAELGDEIPFD
jgi:hypothetical protein